MAPKTFYDAAEMQAKANQAAEKEIRILAREGAELPRSAEVTCEYLGVLKDDGFTLEAKPTLRSTVGYSRGQPHEKGPLRLLRGAQYQLTRAVEDGPEMQPPSRNRTRERRCVRRAIRAA